MHAPTQKKLRRATKQLFFWGEGPLACCMMQLLHFSVYGYVCCILKVVDFRLRIKCFGPVRAECNWVCLGSGLGQKTVWLPKTLPHRALFHTPSSHSCIIPKFFSKFNFFKLWCIYSFCCQTYMVLIKALHLFLYLAQVTSKGESHLLGVHSGSWNNFGRVHTYPLQQKLSCLILLVSLYYSMAVNHG